MKKITLVFLVVVAVTTAFAQKSKKDSLFQADYVLSIMQKVGNWQLDNWTTQDFKRPKYDWTNAAAFTGIMELAKLSKENRFLKFLVGVGDELNWNTGPRRFHADDYCVAQTYANLYMIYKDKKMIEPFQHLADSIIA